MASFIHRARHCLTEFYIEVQGCQTHRYSSARVLVGWENIDIFADLPQKRLILYVGVESFDWSSHSLLRLLGVPTTPVLLYHRNVVLRPHDAQRRLNRVIAFIELSVFAVISFLFGAKHGFCRLIVTTWVYILSIWSSYLFQ